MDFDELTVKTDAILNRYRTRQVSLFDTTVLLATIGIDIDTMRRLLKTASPRTPHDTTSDDNTHD